MKYRQLTLDERVLISYMTAQGVCPAEIARELGRHRSTITRELSRNRCQGFDTCYRFGKAHHFALVRRRRSRRNRHYGENDFRLVRKLLKQEWSPEQIVGHIRRFNLMRRRLSHETIYQYVWRDKADGGLLWKHLRQSSKQRRKRYNAYDSRGRRAGKRHISERPASVDARRIRGHWEIDTVIGYGSKHCIVTLVERKSGFTLIGQLKDRTTATLNKRCIKLLEKCSAPVKTITADNGTEFNQYPDIEAATNTVFYFANPYHSWERGTNENTNGLIRQYLPKKTSMRKLTQQQCDRIAHKLNTRPRKRLNFKTPEEVLYA